MHNLNFSEIESVGGGIAPVIVAAECLLGGLVGGAAYVASKGAENACGGSATSSAAGLGASALAGCVTVVTGGLTLTGIGLGVGGAAVAGCADGYANQPWRSTADSNDDWAPGD